MTGSALTNWENIHCPRPIINFFLNLKTGLLNSEGGKKKVRKQHEVGSRNAEVGKEKKRR
jgi:hypothetical protein